MPKVFSRTQISRWKDIVINGTAHGHSLHRILKRKDMCSRRLVYNWLNPNHNDFDRAFTETLAQARIDSADKVADEVEEIARGVLRGQIDPKAGRIGMMGLQWIARVRNPKKYDERIKDGLGGEANLIQQIYQIQLPSNNRDDDVEAVPQLVETNMGTVHVPDADPDIDHAQLSKDENDAELIQEAGNGVHKGADKPQQ